MSYLYKATRGDWGKARYPNRASVAYVHPHHETVMLRQDDGSTVTTGTFAVVAVYQRSKQLAVVTLDFDTAKFVADCMTGSFKN